MKNVVQITSSNINIYCLRGLEKFSNDFINYCNNNIGYILEKLGIIKYEKIIININYMKNNNDNIYGGTNFSGFFNEKGADVYISLNNGFENNKIFKAIMHEITHHLYKYYVYGKNNPRITWVDEGIAQFISNQFEEYNEDKVYNKFLLDNLSDINSFNLNILNHNDRSFGNNNGYNLSYIAIKYLYETNSHDEFIKIIKDKDLLLNIGTTIIDSIKKYYDINDNRKIK